MIKTYQSSSELSFNVTIGKSDVHVRFNPMSYGGSTFMTGDKVLQDAMEKMSIFGSMFHILAEEEPVVEAKKEEETKEEPSVKVVTVSSYQEAKDYLVDELGISRTQLSSKAKIISQAAANNIKFDGLEESK